MSGINTLYLLTRIADERGLIFEINCERMKMGDLEFYWAPYIPEEAFSNFLLRVVGKYGLPENY